MRDKTALLGIVFDLDGVLVDSEPFHMEMWNETVSDFGIALDRKWFDNFMGTSDTVTARGIAGSYEVPVSWNELLMVKREKVKRMAPERIRPCEGVMEGLSILQEIPKALATSSSREIAEPLLDAAGLRPFFPVIITSDDVDVTKPDPECYLKACRLLDLDPSDCVAVEDSPPGIDAAAGAGLYVLGVASSYHRKHLTRAHMLFETPAAVFHWLQENVAGTYTGRRLY